MKRLPLSEKSLVTVLFVLVIVVFSFAQADTDHLEKANLNVDSPASTSLEHSNTAIAADQLTINPQSAMSNKE